MTNQTNKELRDKILKDYRITTVTQSFMIDRPPKVIEFKKIVNIPIDDLMKLIQSYTNKAISENVERELSELRWFIVKNSSSIMLPPPSMIEDEIEKKLSAIQQERNKLKEGR